MKWRDRVQEYVRERGEGSLRNLEQARRECQDRGRWKLFCLGHPLVGDSVYGKRTNRRLLELTGFAAPRQMLHARRIAFAHPVSGTWMEFDAPLPEDFKSVLEALRVSPG